VLVITRRPGQAFCIGEDIEIKVLEVDGTTIRIGIAAPQTVGVVRAELLGRAEDRFLRRSNGREHQQQDSRVA